MRPMRSLWILAAATCALLSLACSGDAPKTPAPAPAPAASAAPVSAAPAAVGKAYVCPMSECQEVKDQPGKCSKCGMDLVEVNRSDIQYTCTMCNVVESAPGKCPKCGMDLVMRVKTAQEAPPTTDRGT